jgi:hypothetical protein
MPLFVSDESGKWHVGVLQETASEKDAALQRRKGEVLFEAGK